MKSGTESGMVGEEAPSRADGRAIRNPETRVMPSHVLLGRQRRLHIDHGGERYILRETRHGKLILTK
jgi:hemin uptake protein HemP